jgi:uncharacterized protein with gpF-like domain
MEQTTGIQLIAKERKEQIEKHGYTIEKDVLRNTDGQLIQAAIYALTENPADYIYDHSWDEVIDHFDGKTSKVEKLAIAGAFIAAQIDVELYKEANKERAV